MVLHGWHCNSLGPGLLVGVVQKRAKYSIRTKVFYFFIFMRIFSCRKLFARLRWGKNSFTVNNPILQLSWRITKSAREGVMRIHLFYSLCCPHPTTSVLGRCAHLYGKRQGKASIWEMSVGQSSEMPWATEPVDIHVFSTIAKCLTKIYYEWLAFCIHLVWLCLWSTEVTLQ